MPHWLCLHRLCIGYAKSKLEYMYQSVMIINNQYRASHLAINLTVVNVKRILKNTRGRQVKSAARIIRIKIILGKNSPRARCWAIFFGQGKQRGWSMVYHKLNQRWLWWWLRRHRELFWNFSIFFLNFPGMLLWGSSCVGRPADGSGMIEWS